jgi:hypothetical protein
MRGRLCRQPAIAHARAESEHFFRGPPVPQILKPKLRQQRERRGAVAKVPPDADVVARGRVLARQAQPHPILELAHAATGVRPHVRLVLFQPQGFWDEPFCRHGPPATAVDLARGVARGQDARGLLAGSHVHPEDGRAQGLGLGMPLVKGDDRAARGVDAQGGDRRGACKTRRRRRRGRGRGRRVCSSCGERAFHGHAHCTPPLARVLFGVRWLWKLSRVGLGAKAQRLAISRVKDARATRLGAEVDANDAGLGHLG